MSNRAPFPINPELTAIAIAYRNTKLIADEVMPRSPVGKKEFKYLKHTLAEGFTLPNTLVGRTGKPNQVEFTASEETDSTEDFGLDDPVPQDDIANAPAGYDPLGRATEGLTELIALDREKRVADLIFATGTYAAANRLALSGSDQFSDFIGSDPIAVIMDALDAMVMRGNIAVIGRPAFSILQRHPKIVKAANRNSGDSGIATRQAIAELFELDEVLVGEGWINGAKKGQTASMSRVWGKHIALLYRDRVSPNKITFGFTAEFGKRVAGSIPDSNIGLRGGQRVRVGESVKEVVTANDLGYFLQNVVA